MAVQQKLYTVEEFHRFLEQPQNANRRFELIHGEIVEMSPTQQHGKIAGILHGELYIFLKQHALGHLMTETSYQMPGDEHNERIPDVSFIAGTDTPVIERGSVPRMPDLAIEIKSPNDTYKEMREKADYYLLNGTRIVWLVYPEKRLVEVLTPDDRLLLDSTEMLDGAEVVPGFSLPVRSIFPE